MDIDKLIQDLEEALGKAEETDKEVVSEEVNEDEVKEDAVAEDNLQDEAPEAEVALEQPEEEPAPAPEEPEEPAFNDTMSLADTFDAKARIARALEALQGAVEEFKNATADKVDLIKDALLLNSIEGLDMAVEAIESALAAGELLKSELNDPFNAELPDNEEPEEEFVPVQPVENLDDEEEEDIDPVALAFETGETSFADLAGMNLFKEE